MAPRALLAARRGICYLVDPTEMNDGRGVAQPGSALAWGARGRWFKSSRPDHFVSSLAEVRTLLGAARTFSARDVVARIAYAAAAAFVRAVPRRLSYRVAEGAALLRYVVAADLRARVTANLRIVAGPSARSGEVSRLARASYCDFARAVADFLRLPSWPRDAVRVDGAELFEAAHRRGRGIVVVSAHIGSWEVGGAYLASLGVPVHVVARPHALPSVERFFVTRRAQTGAHVVPLDAPVSSLVAPLRRGECVAVLADRPVDGGADSVLFCGRPARLPRGPLALALRTGACVLAAAALRDGDGYRIEWRAVRTDDLPCTAAGIREGTQRVARVLEAWVREHPAQWHAFAPVWDDRAPAARVAAPSTVIAQPRRASA